MRCELGEILRRCVRVDDTTAGETGKADVRERCERNAVLAHPLERGERGEQAGAVVRSDCGDIELPQSLCGLGSGDAGDRLCAFVEREQCDDRKAGR